MNREDVLAAVSRSPDWAPGAGKVYVSDVAKQLGRSTKQIAPELLSLHRTGEIELTRVDLTAAHDQNKLRRSEITDGRAEYHLISRPRPEAKTSAKKPSTNMWEKYQLRLKK